MIEKVEDQSLEELDLEGAEYESSNQLDGESDGSIEQKSISGNSSGHGPSPRCRWNLGLPGERWDNHLLIPSRQSNSQRNCSQERRNAECQLPLGSALPQKSDRFQLSKSENPYRPPHCNEKRLKPLANISEPRIESSRESDQRVSADGITGNDKSGHEIPFVCVDDSTMKPLGESENDPWRNDKGNEVFGANETLMEIIEEILEDNQLTFDDFWAEILETIHLKQESSISPTNTYADTHDSELEIRLPDEDTAPENFNFNSLESGDDKSNSEDEISLPDEDNLISIYDMIAPESSMPKLNPEAEINLPDEDSLISIHDMIAPESSMPTVNSDSLEANKVTSNMAVNTRKKSESLKVTKRGDRSTRVSCKAQSLFHFPGLVTHGKLHSQIFGPGNSSLHLGNDHMNFPPMFMIPNIAPYYIPTLNCFTHSNFHHQSCQESSLTMTKTNDSFSQYSVLQQPNVFPHLLADASCLNPTKQVATPELNAMQFLPLTQQAAYHGFGKSNAVDEASPSFSLWHARF